MRGYADGAAELARLLGAYGALLTWWEGHAPGRPIHTLGELDGAMFAYHVVQLGEAGAGRTPLGSGGVTYSPSTINKKVAAAGLVFKDIWGRGAFFFLQNG